VCGNKPLRVQRILVNIFPRVVANRWAEISQHLRR
jgi:hypothetical protein